MLICRKCVLRSTQPAAPGGTTDITARLLSEKIGAELGTTVVVENRTGTKLTHVPFKGMGPAVAALLGGQVTFAIDNLPSSIGFIRSGQFRALAVTGAERSPQLPDVPTMAEAGIKDMVVTAWFGFVAPAGTPPAIVDKIQQATAGEKS